MGTGRPRAEDGDDRAVNCCWRRGRGRGGEEVLEDVGEGEADDDRCADLGGRVVAVGADEPERRTASVGEAQVQSRPREGGGYPEGTPVAVVRTCEPGHLSGLSHLGGGDRNMLSPPISDCAWLTKCLPGETNRIIQLFITQI